MRRLIGCEPSFNVHRPEGANDFRSIQLSIRAQRFSGYVKGDYAMPNIKNIVTTLTLGGLLAGGVIGLDGAAMAASAGAIGSVNAVSSAWGWTSDWDWGWGSATRGGHFTHGGMPLEKWRKIPRENQMRQAPQQGHQYQWACRGSPGDRPPVHELGLALWRLSA